MYKVYAYDYTRSPVGSVCFYMNVSLDEKMRIQSPELTLTKNAPGSFTFTIDKNNIGNDYIKLFNTIIEVHKDGQVFWRGRVIEEERDAYDNRSFTCEGTLNFLLDTIQTPMHIHTYIETWVRYLLTTEYTDPLDTSHTPHKCHNSYYTSTHTYKRVNIAYWDPYITDNQLIDWYAEYETTWDLLKQVLDAYGIKMRVTYENGLTNLWFYHDYPDSLKSQQTIQFGQNLIKFVRKWAIDELATVIIPIGKKFGSDEEERPTVPFTPSELDAAVTIASVNQGSIALEGPSELISKYGKIYKVVEYSDIEDPANLLTLAQNYFQTTEFDGLTIEVEAIDLSMLMTGTERDINELKLLGQVRCFSRQHGLDKYFPITEIKITLDNPANTTFTLGEKEDAMSTTTADMNFNTNTQFSTSAIESQIKTNDLSLATSEAQATADSALTAVEEVEEDVSSLLTDIEGIHVTLDDMDQTIDSKMSEEDFNTAIANYYTKVQADTEIQNRVNSSFNEAEAHLNDYAKAGYVTFVKDSTNPQRLTGIVISDKQNYLDASAKSWRWTQGGLAFYSSGTSTAPAGIAITSDGKVNANFITTGTMTAARIYGGTLNDIVGNFSLNLETGQGYIKNLQIFSRDLTMEAYNNPGTTGYLYMSTKNWKDGSIFYNASSLPQISVGNYLSNSWRLVVGTSFGVTEGGLMSCTEGRIGNIVIGDSYLRTNESLGSYKSLYLGGIKSSEAFPSGGTYSIAGTSRSDWRLSIGGSFGVTEDGTLYSYAGHFSSAIVDGNISSNSFSSSAFSYNGRSIEMAGQVTPAGAVSQTRNIRVIVSNVAAEQDGYYYTTVTAYVMDGQGGYQLNEPALIRFYIGCWSLTGTLAEITPPTQQSQFTNLNFWPDTSSDSDVGWQHSVVREITVPSGTSISNPVTKKFRQLKYDSRVRRISGVLLAAKAEATGTNRPQADLTGTGITGPYYQDIYVAYYTTDHDAVDAMTFTRSLKPTNNSCLIGGLHERWGDIFVSNHTATASSRRLKKNINSIDDYFDIFFDHLNPVTYQLKAETSRLILHTGFIVDEVENALNEAGMNLKEFAGYEGYSLDGVDDGMLRYEEFIAINTNQIQKLKKRVKELEDKLELLEGEVSE